MYSNNYDSICLFVEQHGSITIDIAKNLFYNTKYGYDSSRRALTKLCKEGYFKVTTDFLTDKKVYYRSKPVSSHRLMLISLMSSFVKLGAEIIDFKIEYKCDNMISDGMLIYKHNNTAKIILIEIDINNKTKEQKYEQLFATNQFQNSIGCFPRVFIIDKNLKLREKKRPTGNVEYVYMDYTFGSLDKYI